jgi:hypothetical protein
MKENGELAAVKKPLDVRWIRRGRISTMPDSFVEYLIPLERTTVPAAFGGVV